MTLTAEPLRSRVRLRAAPRWEPPYDEDGTGVDQATTIDQAALPLTFVLKSGVPAEPEPSQALPIAGEARPAPASGAPTGNPDVKAWTAQLAQAVVDVLAGDRPVTQLLRWTTDEVLSVVRRRATVHNLQRRQAVTRGPRARARVQSVRICEPTDGVAEGTAVVSCDGRVFALALRLEARGDRWQCTALEGG